MRALWPNLGDDTLSISEVERLYVPFCSSAEQAKIVQILNARLEASDRLNIDIDTALVRAEMLRQSIFKKAFAGQLVAQDPTDEPAIALLERIKTNRPKVPQLNKRRTSYAS